MRVLVTRPEPDASKLAELLRARGDEPVLAPLMEIRLSGDEPPAGIADAVLLFTSANGVRAAEAHGVRSSRGVFAVGEATAAAARKAGFEIGGIADGDVAALSALIADRLSKDQLLVHAAGRDLAGDLLSALNARGYKMLRWRAYEALAAKALPASAAAFLGGAAGAVLLYSPRSANLLVTLTRSAGLIAEARRHRALCLSQAVADSAAAIAWASLEVAANPRQETLLDLLG